MNCDLDLTPNLCEFELKLQFLNSVHSSATVIKIYWHEEIWTLSFVAKCSWIRTEWYLSFSVKSDQLFAVISLSSCNCCWIRSLKLSGRSRSLFSADEQVSNGEGSIHRIQHDTAIFSRGRTPVQRWWTNRDVQKKPAITQQRWKTVAIKGQ